MTTTAHQAGWLLVTNGLPRFTVKGNGNTYVHKRLSIGVGGHVPDTVLTVAGSVHIGPDNLTPTIFDYGDQLADYLLWVEKGIVSEDFAIANVDNWSDHVLQDDYDLKPLSEVESFIEQGRTPPRGALGRGSQRQRLYGSRDDPYLAGEGGGTDTAYHRPAEGTGSTAG